MRLMEYLADKIIVILINISSMLGLSLYLLATGNYYTSILLILTGWIVILSLYFMIDFLLRRKYFKEMQEILEKLDKRYLFGEIHSFTPRLEDKLYREILRKSNKSVIEAIRQLEDSNKDYKEYIEGWIHDVKSPLTAINLICGNAIENDYDNNIEIRDTVRKIQAEAGIIEKQVENVLYYARSEDTYKDYLIHKVDLCKIVNETVRKNKFYFIQKNMQVKVELEEAEISTDEKWIEFLLNQIFSNSIKYAGEKNPGIVITGKHLRGKYTMTIEDNGMGIPENEVGRIFEKGFTGVNGRSGIDGGRKSTGIGLYLCNKLCAKLGIGISCESKEGEYTRITLIFPDSDYSGNLSKM